MYRFHRATPRGTAYSAAETAAVVQNANVFSPVIATGTRGNARPEEVLFASSSEAPPPDGAFAGVRSFELAAPPPLAVAELLQTMKSLLAPAAEVGAPPPPGLLLVQGVVADAAGGAPQAIDLSAAAFRPPRDAAAGAAPSLRFVGRGVQLPLQVVKTEGRGWGVRSKGKISAGTFICEYTGNMLLDSDAEAAGLEVDDSYLFNLDGEEKGQVSKRRRTGTAANVSTSAQTAKKISTPNFIINFKHNRRN